MKSHDSIRGWSLTAYLKALHAGGMSWEAIYWHAWAACVVLQVEDVYISALDGDRYMISTEDMMLRIRSRYVCVL